MKTCLISLGLLLIGCVPVPLLVPAPHATLATGTGDLAYAEVAGVRIWAGGGWAGVPSNLPGVVTPVTVTLENHSGQAVRISYQDFALKGGTGFTYAALPPFAIQGVGERELEQAQVVTVDYHPATAVVRSRPPPFGPPRFHHDHFRVAAPYVRFYMGVPLWPHLWAWSLAYHQAWYSHWPTPLPSEDMLRRALPEGVLEDGGVVSGYLYFQHAGREATAELEVTLQDADGTQPLGVARVPFVVQR